jgi:hypothetical protein
MRYILTQRKKPQVAVTFRDNDIGVLGFFRHRNVQSSVKLSFFAKQTILVSGQQKFARISQRASHTYKKNFVVLPLI